MKLGFEGMLFVVCREVYELVYEGCADVLTLSDDGLFRNAEHATSVERLQEQ